MKVSILLSSYNGGVYLREQLDSLVVQNYKDFKVYARDDGSSDNSKDILLEYERRFPMHFMVMDDNAENLKSTGSFLSLLSTCASSDLYMFCDQDDIWDSDKVEQFVNNYRNVVAKSASNVPIALFGDMRLIDSDGKLIGSSFWDKDKIPARNLGSWKHVLAGNVLTGCSSIFNHSAREFFLANRNHCFHHDHQLAILTARYGLLRPIDGVTASYRQHGNNVLGANAFSFRSILKKLFTLELLSHQPMLYGVGQIEYYYLKTKVLFLRMFL